MTAAGSPPAPTPKPAPPRPAQQWFQERPSPYPYEQDALDHIRRLMPPAEPYRAWATFSFTARSGRVNECDLLTAVPAGLFLIEIKSHPGRLENTGSTWNFHGPDRIRTITNPLHLTDLKAKELKASSSGRPASSVWTSGSCPVSNLRSSSWSGCTDSLYLHVVPRFKGDGFRMEADWRVRERKELDETVEVCAKAWHGSAAES